MFFAALIEIYFIAKQNRQIGRTISKSNINSGPTHDNSIQNR